MIIGRSQTAQAVYRWLSARIMEALFLSLLLGVASVLSSTNSSSLTTIATIRKEVRSLSSDEVTNYFTALWTYKNTGRKDGKTYFKTYDALVAHHAIAATNTSHDNAHEWGAFIIWHGVYVRALEEALQSIDSSVAVPYWDWTIDSATSKPSSSAIFTDKYFGAATAASNYQVLTGNMAKWSVSTSPSSLGVSWQSPNGYLRSTDNYNGSPYVNRYVQSSTSLSLPTTTMWNTCKSMETYDTFVNCVWGSIGSIGGQSIIHAGPHMWAGGSWQEAGSKGSTMGDVMDPVTSPNDPLFFSHHSNLERLYYKWRQQTGDALATSADPCGSYYGTRVTDPQPSGHNLDDVFYPYFYAFGSAQPLTVSGACTYMQTANNVYYTYDA